MKTTKNDKPVTNSLHIEQQDDGRWALILDGFGVISQWSRKCDASRARNEIIHVAKEGK